MLDLKTWLNGQGLSVRELAGILEIPLTTVEDWVYRGAQPQPESLDTQNKFNAAVCSHHWVIESSNGPLSEGVCQQCGERREFSNSVDTPPWPISHRNTAQKWPKVSI